MNSIADAQAEQPKMGIELGLARILKLVPSTSFPWRGIHVAGTNGKGSVCAYISASLTQSGVRTGRFTSPHLLDRWDSIALNDKTVDHSLFSETEAVVRKRNSDGNIGASDFEILTATAFEIFSRQKVECAVVEVGMGGRLDATNIIKDPLVTVVTKVGMDHQDMLGDTIEKIAREKAGIMKKGVPCVADASNQPSVLDVLREVRKELEAGELVLAAPEAETDAAESLQNPPPSSKESFASSEVAPSSSSSPETGAAKTTTKQDEGSIEEAPPAAPPSSLKPKPRPAEPTKVQITTPTFGRQIFTPSLLGKYQHQNLACAVSALSIAAKYFPSITAETVQKGISEVKWPGRLEWLSIKSSTGRAQPVFLDGAHNPESAGALAEFVDEVLRPKTDGVTWVLAASEGKDVDGILGKLLKKGDVVSTVAFGPVEGMPHVKALDTKELAAVAKQYVGSSGLVRCWGSDILGALQWSCEVGSEGPIVIAGSLYLASDVTRLQKKPPTSSKTTAKK